MTRSTGLLWLTSATMLSAFAACVGSAPEEGADAPDAAGSSSSSSGTPNASSSSGTPDGSTSGGSTSSSSGSAFFDSGASSSSGGSSVDPRCTAPITLGGPGVQSVECGIMAPFNMPKIDLVIGAYDLAWARLADSPDPCTVNEAWNVSLEAVPAANGYTMHLAMVVAGIRSDYTFSAIQTSQTVMTVEPLCGSELPFPRSADAGTGPRDVIWYVYQPTDGPRYISTIFARPNSNVRYQVRLNPR